MIKKITIASLSLLIASCGITPSVKILTTEEKDQGEGKRYCQFWLKWKTQF